MRAHEPERDALRRIRSHRYRRATWRHMIAVRRRRTRLCGVMFLLMDVVLYAAIHEVSLLFLIVAVAMIVSPY